VERTFECKLLKTVFYEIVITFTTPFSKDLQLVLCL
jgi:hypothetical protein